VIKIVERGEMALWQPMIKALVEQEVARGDTLEAPKVFADLLAGGQMLVAVNDAAGATLMIMLMQEVNDRLRPQRWLYINNFWMPNKDAFLAADLTKEKTEFAELMAGYDKVMFQTRNAALVRFLSGIGLTPQMEGMIYSLNPATALVEGGV
jgi:hypothetical protein